MTGDLFASSEPEPEMHPPSGRSPLRTTGDRTVPLDKGDRFPSEERSGQPENGGDAPATFRALTVPVEPGVTLVEASAGTGKTYALTELVLRLVLDPSVPDLTDADGLPDLRRLLVVTFTVAATEELKTRIRQALRQALDAFERGLTPDDAPGLVAPFLQAFGSGDDCRRSVARLRRALAQAGEAGVFTLDSFCKRVLERSAFESGEPFAFDFTDDAEWLRQRAARDVWHGLAADHPALVPLADAAGWTFDGLLAHQKNAIRFVDTVLLPTSAPLADALARAEQAQAALGVAWSVDAQLGVVDPALWRTAQKNIPFTGDLKAVFGHVAAFAGGDWGELGAVRSCQPDEVAEAIKDGSAAGKAAVADVHANTGFVACRAAVDAIDALGVSLVGAFVERLREASQMLKERAAVLSFDDVIDRLYRALGPEAPTRAALVRSIQAQFAVALIDEFQDTDPKQYRIFRTAFEGRPLFFIGDPKQAIYAFRGADVFAYLEAKTDARQSYTLGTNHRSAPRLVAAVNATFERLGPDGRPFVYDGIPFQPVASRPDAQAGLRGVEPAPPLVWWMADGLDDHQGIVNKDNSRDAAHDAVVTEICRLLNDPAVEVRDKNSERWRRIEAGDLAVLVRKNQQARDLQDSLRRAGVPSVVGKGDDIRASREMGELERVLRAVARPSSRRTVRAALATEMWGWTAGDLACDDTDDRIERVAEGLRQDRAVWRDHGAFRMLTGLLRREDMLARLQSYADRERRLTNLRHALELIHEAETSEGRSPDELLHWVRTRESRTFSQEARTQMRLESDADAVQLVTMHNAKGLEYPVVFVPFAWDDKSDDKEFGASRENPPVAHTDGGRAAVYDLGSEDQKAHRALAEAERLAESLRLTYVAMTRARERLYVVWGPLSGGHMSGLGHLLRDLPIPLDDGLARLDAGAKSQAQAMLKGTLDTLASWVAGQPDMATVPLPRGGGTVERRADAQSLASARTVGDDLRQRVEASAATGSFSAWASGIAGTDERRDDAPDGVADDADDTPESGIFAFAAGPRAGTCLHEILQFADLARPDDYRDSDSENAGRVARTLRLHGLDSSSRAHRARLDAPAAVCDLVARVACAPIPGFGFALRDVAADRSAHDTEWDFHAPRTAAAPVRIADVFEMHGDDVLRAYAPVLRRLGAADAEDLFTGTADLVVQHPAPTDDAPAGGPFYLFDWKSNHLGATPAHYGPDALDRAMRGHHYYLQAHLYMVGLHRHLRARLGNAYDYERHVGGVAYVFLRGLAEGADTGWWTHRPPRALIDALDDLLFAHA